MSRRAELVGSRDDIRKEWRGLEMWSEEKVHSGALFPTL